MPTQSASTRPQVTRSLTTLVSLRCLSIFASLCVALVTVSPLLAHADEKASHFGTYEGYSPESYTHFARTSSYVEMPDGVRLAVDVYRPAKGDVVESKPLPTILYYCGYLRVHRISEDTVLTQLGPWQTGQKTAPLLDRDLSGRLYFWDTGRESIPTLMKHGYVFVRVETRGTGASEGAGDASMSLQEAKDGASIIAWIAEQEWSDGKVGMIGGSYPGMTQLKVASEHPPALKAIFPAVPMFDLYHLTSGGVGLLHKGIIGFNAGQAEQDALSGNGYDHITPVDSDRDGSILAGIIAERQENSARSNPLALFQDVAPDFVATVMQTSEALQLDSPLAALGLIATPEKLAKATEGQPDLQAQIASGLHLYRDTPAFVERREAGLLSQHVLIDRINSSNIPIYLWTGWYDQDTVGAFQLYANLSTPKKITSGVWSHGPNEDNGRADNPRDAYEAQARELLAVESLRWFDYWLKDIDNGVMQDAPIHYALAENERSLLWQGASEWPLPETDTLELYATKATPEGAADGQLVAAGPQDGVLEFTVDYSKTTGMNSRFHDSLSGVDETEYPNMAEHAAGEGALRFSTPPLQQDLTIVGQPLVRVSAKSSAPDGVLFAYLEDVSPSGEVSYLTEGIGRASHAETGPLSYDTLGMPYAKSDRESVQTAPRFDESIVEMKIALQPTGHIFRKGHRIQLVITGADYDNYIVPVFDPAPSVTVYTGGDQGTSLRLPTLPE